MYYNGIYRTKLNKKNHEEVCWFKDLIVHQYVGPLQQYLLLYRYYQINKAWKTRPFEIFGFHVGEMEHDIYGVCLIKQAYHEDTSDALSWKGCLPLDEYKKAWCHFKLTSF